MKKSFADILSSLDSTRDRKLAAKLPSWAEAGCTVPSGLSLEQCSSELTGSYKAGLIEKGTVLCDLTGGLGVDSWSFSKVCKQVHYFERNDILEAAAKENFARLGASNIGTTCTTVDAATELPECDWIFLDPARRAADGSGKKVFLLEDCTPDVLTLLPMLWSRAGHIMLKLSPMADISMVAKRLNARCIEVLGRSCLKEVHVVGLSGEVKELLCILDSSWDGNWKITAASLAADGYPEEFTFSPEEETAAIAEYARPEELVPLAYLFEPDPVLLKAGAFKFPCSRFGLKKLDTFTHLYTGTQPVGELFKTFEIVDALPFDKRSIAEFSTRYPGADVTSRNLPLSSDALRAKLSSKGGGAKATDIHIFGLSCAGSRLLIAARRK